MCHITTREWTFVCKFAPQLFVVVSEHFIQLLGLWWHKWQNVVRPGSPCRQNYHFSLGCVGLQGLVLISPSSSRCCVTDILKLLIYTAWSHAMHYPASGIHLIGFPLSMVICKSDTVTCAHEGIQNRLRPVMCPADAQIFQQFIKNICFNN